MKSFRVIDTRFRILKGGKIGLSLSISLIGSALIFGNTSSYATDYFTDVQSTISDSTTTPSGGTNPITVEKAVNSGVLSSTRTENDTNPVVFKPTSWANSSYTDPTFAAAQTDPMYTLYPARYYLGSQSFSPLELNLTFTTGATSGSISKNSTTFYSTNIIPSSYITDVPGIPTQTLSSISSNSYTANLIFDGSNTVSGSTNIEDGNIKINGTVNFNGAVTAGSIDMDTTNTATFAGDVSLSSGTGNLNFSQDGDIILNSNFSGNITNTDSGDGNITTIGINNINGNIGNNLNFLNTLSIGNLTTISTTTVNGDIFVNSTILNNTTTNSSTLILSNDKNITSTITTSHDNKGILTLSGGTQTVTGQVGEDLKRLAEINAGANSSNSTFSDDVYATNLDVEGTGTVNLDGNYKGTSIRYNADGTVVLADNKNINSSIINNSSTTPIGTLTLEGSSTVSGTVGTDANKLKEINAGANSSNSTFSDDVYATNLDVEGTGTVNLDGNYKGTSIRYNADGTVVLADNKNINSSIINNSSTTPTGTLTLEGSSTVSGTVGTDANKLKEINAGADSSNSTFSDDVYATNLDVEGTGTVNLDGNYKGTSIRYNADGTVVLADNKNINSSIVTNSTTPTGTLTLEGSSTVSGTVGTDANKLKEINAGANSSNSTFSDDVYATNLDVEGTGTVNLDGNYKGTSIRYNADGTVVLADNKNINSSIVTNSTTPTGTLTLEGSSTVSGTVGTDANKLKEINAGANSSNSTFSDDVYATNLDVEGTGTVNLDGNYKGTSIRYNADGTVVLADNKNINSSIINNSSTTPTGTLTLEGSSTVSGTVGTDANKLKEINAGADSSNSTFSDDVYATNLDVEGTGTVNLDGNYKGTSIRYNADGTVVLADNKNINSSIVTNSTTPTGTLTLEGSSTVSGTVGTDANKLKEINAGANSSNSTFSDDVYATNLDVEGTGTVNLDGNYKGTSIRYNADGTVVLADNKNINSSIVTNSTTPTGTLTLEGSSTVSGTVGTDANKLKEINANGITGKTVTFEKDVYAITTNINSLEIKFESDLTSNIVANMSEQGVVSFIGDNSGKSQIITGNIGSSGTFISTLNIGESGNSTKYSTTTITGNIYANSTVLNNNGTANSSTLVLGDGSDIISTITTADANMGILTLEGSSTVSGTVGTDANKLKEINAGANSSNSTFSDDVYATNLDVEGTGTVNLDGNYKGTSIRYNADGTVVLADNKNINSSIINNSSTTPTGTLTLEGSSTVSGTVGTDANKLKEINAATDGETVTFEKDVYAITTNLGSGITNFNTISGNTISNIVFSGDGKANLNGYLDGNINFAGNDAVVNIADGKGILGSVETLANNTGILNFSGDGVVDDLIGSALYGINELNINTNDEQDKDSNGTVTSNGLLARKEIFADIINLRNNATLTLADNANITNTGLNSLIISTDNANTGNLVFEGSSSVTGTVGSSSKNLESIVAGASGETVTFNNMVYASNLKYASDGTVILKGNNDTNNEGFIGNVDFNSNAGTLEIADNVNLTTGSSGIEFTNANDATLTFNGTSTVYGVLGGNTTGNSTFERIYAGANNEIVTFKNDVYVEESNDTTFHVSGNGVVNFEGDLYGDLIFDADGIVNVADSKSIIVSSVPTSIRTKNDGKGTVNFGGTTTLYTDIGTEDYRLNNVSFSTVGSSILSQNLDKNIYSKNTTIGNSLNTTTLNIKDDVFFAGNLNLNKNSIINVSDYNITIANNLDIAKDAIIKMKVYTTDLSAGQAVENGNSGNITSSSLTIANNTKFYIDYDGSWEGAGKYNLITTSNDIITNYYGSEINGLVTDNSIIDSVIKINGTNLTLYADRTNGGSFNPEDLYIEKSEIGKDYSNGASQSLAGYANEAIRDQALADIIRNIEELNDGVLTDTKKQEMINTQRLLAPTANSSNMQTSITASNLAMTTIKGRLSDIRTTETNNFTPNIYRTLGMSSGNYYSFDTSFWLKAMGGKATQDKVNEYDGFDTTTYGFVGGMDKITNEGTIFGAAVAYSTTKTNQDNLASDSSDTTSIQATLYSSLAFENAYIDSYLSYAKHKTDGTRTANSGKLTSSVDADQISAKVETGYSIPVNDGISVTPFASLEYSLLNQKGYTEKGTAYQNDALKVDSLKLNRGTVEVGAKLTSNIELEDTLIIPQLSASVYNSFGDNSADIKAQYIGGGKEFVTPTSELNKTMYNVGLGVETKISDSTSLIFDMDYDRSKDGKFQGYSGTVTFGISF